VKFFLFLIVIASQSVFSKDDCDENISPKEWNNCYGTIIHSKGGKYEGEFKDGLRHGLGIYYFPSGGVYEGQWVKGESEGKGKQTWVTGETYEGEYKKGKREGYGIFSWGKDNKKKYLRNDRYEGDFKDNEKHGLGTYFDKGKYPETEYYLRGYSLSDICVDMGLEENTEGFADCVIKLMDEI